QGLVLPPTVAPKQVVIVPIWQEGTKTDVLEYAEGMAADLRDAGVRVELDDRDEHNPGFKFNEWELKGVPVRIEVGPNEVREESATLVHRPDGESHAVDRTGLVDAVEEHFDTVYAKLYAAAEENLTENVREAADRAGLLGTLGRHGGYVKTPWCGEEACEDEIKDQIAAEIVLVPFEGAESDTEPIHDGEDCAVCGDEAVETAYFAKSY
ncbi:MAG: proline--tRNA ligase anticodon binding domain-containing protein, partial [Haloarculaceae archaeon]